MTFAATPEPAQPRPGPDNLPESTAGYRTAARPVALFVLGMARSGTSALTRVLSFSGGTLPAGMCGADANNPLGYWEPRAVIMLNETILRRHDSNWYDPTLRLQEDGVLDPEEKAEDIASIQAFLATLPAAPLVVIKDPRITALTGMWFAAARLAGLDVRAVISVRHPQEVISSAEKYARISPELSSALWLKYNLLAERHTRDVPRVFVEYADLLEDWRREMKRIAATLEIDLGSWDEAAIEEFLTPDLRRQRHCGPVPDFCGTDWISAVHKALSMAAQDEPADVAALDRVFQSYRVSEHDFRMAFSEFRAQTNSLVRRVFKPFIVRRILEVAAIAHRRKGAWA